MSFEILSQKHIRKTRKPYQCNYCLRKFPVGSEKNVDSIVSNGDFYTWVECPTCDALAPEVFAENPDCRDEGLTSESYREYVIERFGTIEKADEYVAGLEVKP